MCSYSVCWQCVCVCVRLRVVVCQQLCILFILSRGHALGVSFVLLLSYVSALVLYPFKHEFEPGCVCLCVFVCVCVCVCV